MKNYHLSTKFIAALLACSFTGCTTADSLMNKSLLKGTENNNKAALELTDFLQKSSGHGEESLRCWALRSLSYFSEVPDNTLDTVGKILTGKRSDAERAWAAYTLGHFQRRETIPYFLTALKNHPTNTVDYYILESLTRQFSNFNGDSDLSIELLTALNTYISQTKHTPPTMYNLLEEYVSTLSTLILAMENILEKNPADKRGSKNFLELYTGIYNIFRSIDIKEDKLLADFTNNQLTIEKAFTTAYKGLDTSYQPAFLLYAWYASQLSNNPELAQLATTQLWPWLQNEDPKLRQLVIWGLLRTELYDSTAKDTLLKHLSQTETDANILFMLANYRHFQGKPDVIQQLRGYEVAK